MAEVVFQNLEGMLPELEELEKQEVFTREEIRIIIKRRTDFEYKLQKRIVEKQDILNYLEYELKLNLLQKKRSKRMKLKLYSTATLSVTRRIHALFRKALLKFGNDMKLWVQYIDFCKKTDSLRSLGLAFGKLIQQHASNPDVWIMAAKYEFEEVNNAANARSLMQRSLRYHKQNKMLWLEMKQRRKVLGIDGIELKEVDDSEPKKMEEFLANKTALIVFQNALKQINDDLEFCFDFVEICQSFEETEELEKTICNCITTQFPLDENMYEAQAKRGISRLKKHTDQIVTDAQWTKAEETMEEMFQEALEKMNTSLMWEKYVCAYGELLQDSSSPLIARRRMKRILSILQSAEEKEKMTESMYIFWSDMLTSIDDRSSAHSCLSRALKTYNHDPIIWQKYLLLTAEHTSSWSDYEADFKKCFLNLKKPNLQIWQMYVDAAVTLDSHEKTTKVFEDAIKREKDMREEFLPQYLDWVFNSKGIEAARKLYNRVLKELYPRGFLIKCLQVEQNQDAVDLKRIRMLYERLIDDSGKQDEDIWLDYIKFEIKHCGDAIERPGFLYSKAKKTLEGKHNIEFLTKYALMNT